MGSSITFPPLLKPQKQEKQELISKRVGNKAPYRRLPMPLKDHLRNPEFFVTFQLPVGPKDLSPFMLSFDLRPP
jgi:hypothetical protein